MDAAFPFKAEDINRREIWHYLGIHGKDPDDETKSLTEDCISELMTKVSPRSFTREYPLSLPGGDVVDFTCFQTVSSSLRKYLDGCMRVILFAATLGDGADFLIRKYERIQMSRAAVLQAASAAMTETYCNTVNGQLSEQYAKENAALKSRFSPGYGDFALENQRFFMEALQMDRTVGIRLTEGFLMLPTKSVTAVIGVYNI